MRKRLFVLLMVTALLVSISATAYALGIYRTTFDSTYGVDSSYANNCGLCHQNGIPGATRVFYGVSFQAQPNHGFQPVEAFRAIEGVDSDGDGFTNIDEINALTNPSDPNDFPAAAAMPPPVTGQLFFQYPAVAVPVLDSDPLLAKPMGVGAVSTGGDTFNVQVGMLPFTEAVDLYFLILIPEISSDPFILTPSGFQAFSVAGAVPWKDNIQPSQINETLVPDFPVAQIPEGTYVFALVAAPTDSLNTFYFWLTDFTVGPRDLDFHLRSMVPHINQLTEISVISGSNVLAARAILDPLTDADFDLVMRRAVPAGVYRLDFFSDFNNNRSYDAPPTDHAWRLDLPATGVADLTFVHNTNFTDISSPAVTQAGDFTLNFTGMTPHLGQLLELRVIREATNETVGMYRLGAITLPAFTITIPGIIGVGIDYRVDFWADFNNNKLCDAPPTDHAWRLTGTGGPTGLTMSFNHNTNFTNVCQ